MRHTYIVNAREDVVMVTVFPGDEAVRMQPNTYEMGRVVTRSQTATYFRYWRRCGWTIRRVV